VNADSRGPSFPFCRGSQLLDSAGTSLSNGPTAWSRTNQTTVAISLAFFPKCLPGITGGSYGQHRELILNYFRAQKLISSGVVEGLNNKAKVTMRKSYGFRTYRVLELALYHSLGKLPDPESTHDFF
jgi:hypothetical protein